jgi:phospholipase/carboxylesterase
MALSSYLPLAESLPHEAPAANEETPIFTRSLRPGRTLKMGAGSMTFLVGSRLFLEWQPYPMPRSVCPQEIGDIGAWLRKILNA